MNMLFDQGFTRYRKSRTIDCGARTIDFNNFDAPGYCLNHILFNFTGSEAVLLA
jgi:hypothetical protein